MHYLDKLVILILLLLMITYPLKMLAYLFLSAVVSVFRLMTVIYH